MHPNADNLTALERQLAACQPTAEGLDTNAMLFAAGQSFGSQARGHRWVWPAATFAFAVLSFLLGTSLVNERSERLALADRLSRQSRWAIESTGPTTAPLPAESFFAARRMIESDPDTLLARSGDRSELPRVPTDEPAILHAWSLDVQP